MNRMLVVTLSGFAFTAVAPCEVAAQDYPTRPVRIVSPYPPGGGADALARMLAKAFTESMGQPFVVENRSGASGMIGTDVVAKAPGDGYTLLLATSGPNAILPAIKAKLPYDARKDFAPISLVAVSDYLLVVHPSMPVKSVADLLALARARPREVVFASTGTFGTPHMAIELMQHMAKVRFVHVPYRGGSPALTAVISGEAAALFASGLTATAHIENKRARAIAVSGKDRSPHSPNLPPVAETLPGFDVTQWYGLIAPAGTPNELVERLSREVAKALKVKEVREQILRQKADPVHNTPTEYRKLIEEQIRKWGAVAESAGIKEP